MTNKLGNSTNSTWHCSYNLGKVCSHCTGIKLFKALWDLPAFMMWAITMEHSFLCFVFTIVKHCVRIFPVIRNRIYQNHLVKVYHLHTWDQRHWENFMSLNQMEEYSELLVANELDETKVVLETRVRSHFPCCWLHLTYKEQRASFSINSFCLSFWETNCSKKEEISFIETTFFHTIHFDHGFTSLNSSKILLTTYLTPCPFLSQRQLGNTK